MPLPIIITHFINLFAIILLVRSGLHILADHPLLYWTDHTKSDNYWLKFGKKKMPKDKLWTAHDEAENIGHWALPGGGHREFGMARNWHFTAATIWIITGIIYWGYLFTTGSWHRLIPTSWAVFPGALHDMVNYMTFHAPPLTAFHPYDNIQQLTYAMVVFILAPIMILTALAMSPAFNNRFPRYSLLFGGRRQVARSIHFIGMVFFCGFLVIHVTMVSLVYFEHNIKLVTFGHSGVDFSAAIIVFLSAILFLLVFNVVATYFTLNHRISVRRVLTGIVGTIVHTIFGRLRPRRTYSKNDISDFFRVNGYPPETEEFRKLQKNNFANWQLQIGGQVENQLSLSLADLKKMPKKEQITKHICIMGWSAIGQWGGVKMKDIINSTKPKDKVKYVVFWAYDVDNDGKPYYEALRLDDMYDDQTILAYEMNWKKLPLEHGAPLRLRCERKLGFKMVKYIKAIEFVDSFSKIGQGRGGYSEDDVMFDWEASI